MLMRQRTTDVDEINIDQGKIRAIGEGEGTCFDPIMIAEVPLGRSRLLSTLVCFRNFPSHNEQLPHNPLFPTGNPTTPFFRTRNEPHLKNQQNVQETPSETNRQDRIIAQQQILPTKETKEFSSRSRRPSPN